MNSKKTAFFTRLLLQWNEKQNKRQMPWKGEKDPYKIWLSEIILQQTRVEQGLEYYNRFITKYPSINKLAAAPETAVFKLWEGLGYYSRCKNLIATAKFISQNLKGIFPRSYEDILKLKGVGPYTAAAITSFAYNLPFAVVDGNVMRVLSRFFAISTPVDSTEGKKYFSALANKLLDKSVPALYNQAIMDFGATVCKPQLPLCSACVLQNECVAFKTQTIPVYPVKEGRLIKKHRWFYYIIAEWRGSFFIRKRNQKDIWQNLHEFILVETDKSLSTEKVMAMQGLFNVAHKNYNIVSISRNYQQQLTHQTIHGCFIHISVNKKIAVADHDLIEKIKMKQLAFPGLINTYFAGEGLVLFS
jgi:A/G-specific adenine glycosylase